MSIARSIRKRLRYWIEPKRVTIDGVALHADLDHIPRKLRDLMYREVYEDTERNILLKILKPGSRVLEIGTGIGFISLLSAKICGAENVMTYEANAAVESLIRANYALNGVQPTLIMRAVTRDGRRLVFHAHDSITSSSSFDREGASRRVTVESDIFADILDQWRPDVLIMDVEGSEYELLMDAGFLRVRDIIVELHPHIIGSDKTEEIVNSLKLHGYVITMSDRKTFHFRKV